MPFNPTALQNAQSNLDDAPPNGQYDAEMAEWSIFDANTDGRTWLKFTWRAIAGAQRDESWQSMHTLDEYDRNGDPNAGLAVTGNTLAGMGIDLAAIADEDALRRALRDQRGRPFRVEIKRNPPYINTYVSHALDVEPSQPMTADVERVPDRDATPADAFAGEPEPSAPPKGSIDPVTGEPIPF